MILSSHGWSGILKSLPSPRWLEPAGWNTERLGRVQQSETQHFPSSVEPVFLNQFLECLLNKRE